MSLGTLSLRECENGTDIEEPSLAISPKTRKNRSNNWSNFKHLQRRKSTSRFWHAWFADFPLVLLKLCTVDSCTVSFERIT